MRGDQQASTLARSAKPGEGIAVSQPLGQREQPDTRSCISLNTGVVQACVGSVAIASNFLK
jgi:hypothetical protein